MRFPQDASDRIDRDEQRYREKKEPATDRRLGWLYGPRGDAMGSHKDAIEDVMCNRHRRYLVPDRDSVTRGDGFSVRT
jgi:hypothetical protein